MPALLEREEVVRQGSGGGEGAVATLGRVREERLQPVVEPHLAELDPRLVRLDARHGANELHDARAAAASLQEAEGALDLAGPERVPLAAQPDERLLRGGERA